MMSEEFKKKMDLHKLKSFLNSFQNIEFLMQAEESIDVSALSTARLRMRDLDNEPTVFIPIDSSQQEIDNWLISSYDLFNLGDVFYLGIDDFPAAPWIKVKVSETAHDWLLSIYNRLISHRINFVSPNLDYIFEFRQQEHRFSTFIEKV